VGNDSRPVLILRGLLCLVKLFSPRVALRAPTGRNNRGCVGKFGTVAYVPVRAVRDDDSGSSWHGSDATPRQARSQGETGDWPNAPVMHRVRIREPGSSRQDHPSGLDSDRDRKRRGSGKKGKHYDLNFSLDCSHSRHLMRQCTKAGRTAKCRLGFRRIPGRNGLAFFPQKT
jgi:hypothetical protein